MKLILCSNQDLASMNILEALLSMESFDEEKFDDIKVYKSDSFSIALLNERLIYSDHIDEKLSKFLSFDDILFASRHSSKDGRKIFTVHVSGNPGNAEFGGKSFSLAKPSPITIKNYVMSIKDKLSRKPDFEFSLEVTHHGPSEIKTPSAFYEIGSNEEAWRDKEAAEIVAESLIEAIKSERKDWKIAVGVGGTHYAPRQTEIILQTSITFGHNFVKYTFDYLNAEILSKAIELSKAEMLIYDEKSVISNIKQVIYEVAEKCKVEVYKSREVKGKFSL
ncbi:MAG: D-aminoacyl-tRNA deacylase [Archaeoglobaceae archaeon]